MREVDRERNRERERERKEEGERQRNVREVGRERVYIFIYI